LGKIIKLQSRKFWATSGLQNNRSFHRKPGLVGYRFFGGKLELKTIQVRPDLVEIQNVFRPELAGPAIKCFRKHPGFGPPAIWPPGGVIFFGPV
jgi:hypothetical protein